MTTWATQVDPTLAAIVVMALLTPLALVSLFAILRGYDISLSLRRRDRLGRRHRQGRDEDE